jgi:hypothetical protein
MRPQDWPTISNVNFLNLLARKRATFSHDRRLPSRKARTKYLYRRIDYARELPRELREQLWFERGSGGNSVPLAPEINKPTFLPSENIGMLRGSVAADVDVS